MPELPEVEIIKRGLNRLVAGQKIIAIKVTYPRMIQTDLQIFEEVLMNQTIHAVKRRGKYLLFDLGQATLVSHLRMEGKYMVFPTSDVPDHKHIHAHFDLSNKQTLVYQDVRKFGTMELVPTSDLSIFFAGKKMGPEPIESEFKLNKFRQQLSGSQKKIKPYLLDQTLVVGLGNIYVDEALWLAKIHPAEIARHLTPKQIKLLRQAIIDILAKGIEKGGSTIRTYFNAFGDNGTMQKYLQVYGKTGQPCIRCGTLIEKIQLAGRGTHFCPTCQKLRKI